MSRQDVRRRTKTLTSLSLRASENGAAPVASPPPADLRPAQLDRILATLDDALAEEIVSIPIGEKSAIADSMVVASGRSHRHVGAIVDRVVRDLKEHGFGSPRVEGLPHCDWVLIDAGDTIVHVFRPEVRTFYNLEKMWMAEPPRDARPVG